MALPSMTLAELRTAAKQRADMVGSSFVTDAEWTQYINHSLYELYDMLVAAYGDDYFATSGTVATDGTNERFALPATFYKLLKAELQLDSTNYETLRRFSLTESNRAGDTARPRYRLSDDYIWFSPLPVSGLTVRLWYVPQLTALSAESDSFNGKSGWLEYVVVDAAIKARVKEESDVGPLMIEKAALVKRIEAMAPNRDAGSPAVTADVYGVDNAYNDNRRQPGWI